MHFIKTKRLKTKQKKEIIALWNQEYPKKIAYQNLADFNKYLDNLIDLNQILVLNDHEIIQGWFADFTRKDERWFVMIIDASIQGNRVGSKLLDMAKQKNAVLNGWVTDHNTSLKKDGSNYKSPIRFYEKNGFVKHPGNTLRTEKISAIKMSWKR